MPLMPIDVLMFIAAILSLATPAFYMSYDAATFDTRTCRSIKYWRANTLATTNIHTRTRFEDCHVVAARVVRLMLGRLICPAIVLRFTRPRRMRCLLSDAIMPPVAPAFAFDLML